MQNALPTPGTGCESVFGFAVFNREQFSSIIYLESEFRIFAKKRDVSTAIAISLRTVSCLQIFVGLCRTRLETGRQIEKIKMRQRKKKNLQRIKRKETQNASVYYGKHESGE